MNYYEELGLSRNATVPEIRQAYKVLARLVHPDGHTDEQVRAMAERQMKRLNEILAILTDPQRRREYDGSLAAGPGTSNPAVKNPAGANAAAHRRPVRVKPQPVPPWTSAPVWAQVVMQNWFWICLVLVILGVGFWYVAEGKPRLPDTTAQVEPLPMEAAKPQDANSGKVDPSAVRNLASAPPDTPNTQTERPPVQVAQEVQHPQVAQGPPQDTAPLALPPTAERPKAPPVVAKPEPPKVLAGRSPEPAHSFAGNWLYVPDANEKPLSGSYPATYVELLLAEEHGGLSGSYRARYIVPDLAVSPEVSFRVQGVTPAEKSAKLNWTSTDGARGEAEVTLLKPNLVDVKWWTTEAGGRAALTSGTAKLIRQQAP